MSTIRVRVPCSTSNLGAGFDCIGLALNRYLTASLHTGEAALEIERSGTLGALSEGATNDLVTVAARAHDCELRGRLVLDSDIPVGRGLGSSAAAAVAGLMLAGAVRGKRLERSEIAAAATSLEGHPDNAVPATFGGLMAAVTDAEGGVERVHVHRLRLSDRLRFVFAAPDAIVSTKAARRTLPEQVAHAAAARSLARVVALVEGLAEADPDLLRLGFADELHVPYRLPLIPGGAAVMEAGRDAGAHAVTVSGSGSGLIAVCDDDSDIAVCAAMRDTFARVTGAPAIAFIAEPDLDGAQYLES